MRNLIISCLTGVVLWCATGTAAAQAEPPKLVVKIIVSQMRYDYLNRFSKNFSRKGFNLFVNEGVNCTNARYNYSNSTSPAGMATITTGTNPSMHGIVSQAWIDYTTNEQVNAVEDRNYLSIGTEGVNAQYAPTKLTVSTIGDELKRDNRSSKVISIALDHVSSIIPGGRAADAAYWFDTYNGKWTTSTYYMNNLPGWVENYNGAGYIEAYKERVWNSVLLPSSYVYTENSVINNNGGNSIFSSIGSLFGFKGRKDYPDVVRTPIGTDILMDFVKSTIIYENLGKSENPDLLIVTVDPTRYVSELYGTESMETEDAYYRLDEHISYIVEFINTQLGTGNVMFVLTSDHGANDTHREDGKASSGVFNVMQFRVLINGFLNSQYGTESWVTDYRNRSLYLNRRVAFEKGLNLAEIQTKAAAFAMQFRGVSQAVTATALQNNHFSGGALEKMQNGYYSKHSGDVVLNLMPGWIEDDKEGVVSTGGSMYEYDTHVPLMWYGAGLGSETLHTPVDMTDIAPTLSRILEVSQPNAVSGREIVDITSKFKH